MKKNLKITLIALIAILLTLVAFVGIFVNNKNILPKYLLGRKLVGSREIELSVDTTVNQVKYDENGNVVTENETVTEENSEETEKTEETKNYTTVDEPVNPEESLNKENYNLVKKILAKRLDTLNVPDYKIKLNQEDGKIILDIPEDEQTDEIVSYLTQIGSFEIVDAEDNNKILMNNDDLKNVQVAYNTGSTGATSVYLKIMFDKEGKKKLNDITNEYIMTTDADDNTTEKKVTLKMEGEEILSTYFSEPLTTGEMQLSVGTASTDVETIEEYLKSAAGVAMLLNCGKMPITYTNQSEKFVDTTITSNQISIAIYVLLGIAIVSFIFIAIKYKKYGLLTIFGSITAIDILLIVIRYANVYLTIESICAFIALIIFNCYIIKNLISEINKNMDEEEIKKSMFNGLKKSIDGIVVILTFAVVFTFFNWTAISSIGNILFWGIISIAISHLIFTKTLLLTSNRK